MNDISICTCLRPGNGVFWLREVLDDTSHPGTLFTRGGLRSRVVPFAPVQARSDRCFCVDEAIMEGIEGAPFAVSDQRWPMFPSIHVV